MTDKDFCGLPWHEAKLLAFRFGHRDANQQAEVSIDIGFDPRYNIGTKHITFKNCTYVALKCDLDYMRVMGDVINNARVGSAESLKDLIEEPADVTAYRKYSIDLIPPSGVIEVFAKNVSMDDFSSGNVRDSDR
jgi:hypothetical protein